MSDTIDFIIDDRKIRALPDETILQAAIRNGIPIPNLCYHKNNLTHTGACRLCLVKIEGRPGMHTSCAIYPEPGMIVTAFSPELDDIRKMLLDIILSDHLEDCANCSKDSGCELQDLTYRYNLGQRDRVFHSSPDLIKVKVDTSSPVLEFDPAKCILCKRCIKACFEVQGKGVLSFYMRSNNTTVSTGYEKWFDSECDGCGECVQACPVGAIVPKQIQGAYERIKLFAIEKIVRTTCPYCGVGCQIDVHTKKSGSDGLDKVVYVTGADVMPNLGRTCVKGRFGLDFLNRPDRLKMPMIRKNGILEETTWKEAIEFIGSKFTEIKEKNGSNSLAGLASAKCTNEENYIFQKFMRAVIGTNNVDHCARLCHASTVAGLAASFGSGAMTNSIDELEHASVIIVIGSNTTETHPVISTFIKRAVLFHNAKLIVIDPRKIDLVRFATLWLQQKNGTDIALINGLMNIIIKNNWENQTFIEKYTENFDAMKEMVKKYDPKMVESITGIPSAQLMETAKLYSTAKQSSIVYSMGITQHAHGTDNVKSVSNLAMLTGQIGRESTGVNPLRGQNNVQGACDMGSLPNVFPGYQKVDDPVIRSKFEVAWNTPVLSNAPGLTVTEIMDGALTGKIKGLYIMGENPMLSDPDLNHVKEALKKVEFLVVQDIFPTETTEFADVVLPVASFAEKNGTYTNTERRVLPIHKIMEAPGQAKEDSVIIQELAQAMGYNWNYSGSSDILHEINELTPQYAGITPERLQNGEKLQWPCPNDKHPGSRFLHRDGKFTRGKGLFFAIEHVPPKETTDIEYPFVLSTGRNYFLYHTNTMTGRTKALPQYVPAAYVEMCKEDCLKLGVDQGDKVKITSRRGVIEIGVKLSVRVAKGCIFIPFHFREAAANILTNNVVDPIAKIPEYKACAVRIEKI